jgi:hypothetical protein
MIQMLWFNFHIEDSGTAGAHPAGAVPGRGPVILNATAFSATKQSASRCRSASREFSIARASLKTKDSIDR